MQASDTADTVRSWTGVPYLAAEELRHVHGVEEFEPLARERMMASSAAYVAGWAGTGATMRANVAAFRRHVLLPRVLVDVGTVDLRTTVLGRSVDLPILFAPSGYQRLAHPEGEAATARAAARVGTTMVLSTSANTSIEDVAAAAAGGPSPWYQLYWFTDRGVTRSMVERAAAAGFGAIVLTVDAPVRTWREGEQRVPVEIPPGVRSVNTDDLPLTVAPDLTWRSLEWLRSISSLPLVLKGILTAEDTRLAVEHGVDGVICSNHGGRSLDWSVATVDALPEMVAAADGRLEVYMDGGVRRGTDVLKALALGARAVLLGRPVVWALGAGGEAGVVRLMELVRGEFASVMGLCGCPSVDRVTHDIVALRDPAVAT